MSDAAEGKSTAGGAQPPSPRRDRSTVSVTRRTSAGDSAHVETLRVRASDGASTTVHVSRYPLATVRARVVRLDPPQPVAAWAPTAGVSEAISGGFFAKPAYEPLGLVRIRRHDVPSRPFRAPWDARRACLCVRGREVVIASRSSVPLANFTDVLQAGPLLVADGAAVVDDRDPEGFSTTSDEFDQDLTAERLPRMAIAATSSSWLGVAVDGRSESDAGLRLTELANLLVSLGAKHALNLDGGSSSALLAAGRLRNTPREDDGTVLAEGGATTTAIAFVARS